MKNYLSYLGGAFPGVAVAIALHVWGKLTISEAIQLIMVWFLCLIYDELIKQRRR